MKIYAKSSGYTQADMSYTDPIFGYYLKSDTGSMDDILVYGKRKSDVLEVGEMIASLFRDATPLEYRSDRESDDLVDDILDTASRNNTEIASDNSLLSDSAYDPVSNELIIESGSIERIPVELVRIYRGNWRI